MSRKVTPNRLFPRRLTKGSVVALVAPAFRFKPALLDQGRAFLEQHYGVTTVTLDNAWNGHAYFADTDEKRLEELFHWLTRPDVDAVMAIRGGYGCARIYPRLLERLRAAATQGALRPKILLGYSDLTVLLNGLYQDLGWVTFHGPVIAGRPFRTPVAVEEETFRRSLFTTDALGAVRDAAMTSLVTGTGRGKLVGGCLSLVASSLGTSYEVDTDDKVLFLEDVDERPYRIDRMLTQLLHAGKLDRIKGLVFGQMASCDPAPETSDPSQTTAAQAIDLAVGEHLRARGIPLVLDFPAGHGPQQATFPIGCEVEVRATAQAPEVVFLEPGVA